MNNEINNENTKEEDALNNIDYVQYLNRIVLEEAKKHITEELPGDAGDGVVPVRKNDDDTLPQPTPEQIAITRKRKVILKRRDRMWGLRNPIVWVLEQITDTELKIFKQRPSSGMNKNTPPPLDEKDVALVKHYLERQTEQ